MLKQFVDAMDKNIMASINNIHTALPGRIVDINADSACVSIQPYGKFVTHLGDKLSYPVLTEVPVAFPAGSASNLGIAFPLAIGDDCIVIISEVELDEFLRGSESQGSMKFDLSNAMAVPGLMKPGNTLFKDAVQSGSIIIKGKGASISISGGSVSIEGDLSVNGNITCTGSFPCNA